MRNHVHFIPKEKKIDYRYYKCLTGFVLLKKGVGSVTPKKCTTQKLRIYKTPNHSLKAVNITLNAL